MSDSSHIDLQDLILFIKGDIKIDKKGNDEKIVQIISHLEECADCLKKFKSLEMIMSDEETFNKIWEQCLPHIFDDLKDSPGIIDWISEAILKADKKFSKKLLEIKGWVSGNPEELASLLIPILKTTRASSRSIPGYDDGTAYPLVNLKGYEKINDLNIHFDKCFDFNIFKVKRVINGELFLLSDVYPGYTHAVLIEDSGDFICSELVTTESAFYFLFKGIRAGQCFIQFDRV